MSGIRQHLHERVIYDKLARLKSESGSHSPSIQTLRQTIPELEIRVDACFLSNPHATDLFMKYLEVEVINAGLLREVLEYYPSQNRVIAAHLAQSIGVPPSNIIVGNGATELIQAVMYHFVHGKVVLPIPTFSPYYEFARPGTDVSYHQLSKARGYALDIEDFARSALSQSASAAILINPNNPTGAYLGIAELRELLERLRTLDVVVVDESFIHFAREDETLTPINLYPLAQMYPNLILVKSMSKDFGVAGARAGYAVMSSERVDVLLADGFLWNSNGIAEYFFSLYSRPEFRQQYESVRRRAVQETVDLQAELSLLPRSRVYPSHGNFVLLELLPGLSSGDLVSALLVRHGIYLRNCDDKIGLQGSYVRVASRGADDNSRIVEALKDVLL